MAATAGNRSNVAHFQIYRVTAGQDKAKQNKTKNGAFVTNITHAEYLYSQADEKSFRIKRFAQSFRLNHPYAMHAYSAYISVIYYYYVATSRRMLSWPSFHLPAMLQQVG